MRLNNYSMISAGNSLSHDYRADKLKCIMISAHGNIINDTLHSD